MSSEGVYSICDDETGFWHAVLGNYHPDREGRAPPFVVQVPPVEPMPTTQRLCDQHLVVYKYVSIRSMDGSDPLSICGECIRIKQLMAELATQYPEEVEDGTAERLATS